MDNETTLKYFENNKDRVDDIYNNILEPISADIMVFDIELAHPMDVERIFTRLDSTRADRIVSRKDAYGNQISYRFMTVAVGHNYIAGFQKEDLDTRIAYIVYDDNGAGKSEIVKEHVGKKYINIGIQGELSCGGNTYYISLWVWNKGSIHMTMGLRQGNSNKIIPVLSELPNKQSAYDGVVEDLFFVLWDHAISHGNPKLPMPGKESWRLTNNSFTTMITRPWTLSHNIIKEFKVHTSLVLNYHIVTQPYEGGYIVVGRHDRNKANDTYFMLDIAYVTFDLLFSTYADIVRGPGNNSFTVHGFKINKDYWTEAKGIKSERGTRKSLVNMLIKTATLSTLDNKLRITLSKNGVETEKELLVKISDMPRVVIKVWQSGKIQMNSYSKSPMLTAWMGVNSFIRGLGSVGIPQGLMELSKGHVSAFEWINSLAGKSIIDLGGVRSRKGGAGVKVSLGRRGRKPKPSAITATAESSNHKDKKTNVDIDTKSGRLFIDGKNTNHKTSELERAANVMKIPIRFDDKRKQYLKSRAEITRDIVMALLLTRGIPAYTGSKKSDAIGQTLAYVSTDWEKKTESAGSNGESTFNARRAYMANLIEKERKARTITSNKRNSTRSSVKSPLYPDDVFSPVGKKLPTKQSGDGENNSNQNADNFDPSSISHLKKQYMVLDALFGYSSFDI